MTRQNVILIIVGLLLFIAYPALAVVLLLIAGGIGYLHIKSKEEAQSVSKQFIKKYKSNLKLYLSNDERLLELEEAFRTVDHPKEAATYIKNEVLRQIADLKPSVDVVLLLEKCLKYTGDRITAEDLYDDYQKRSR